MFWDKDPFEEIMRLRREMDKLFDSFFDNKEVRKLIGSGKSLVKKPFRLIAEPVSDVKVKDKDVEVKLGMPGVSKKDIRIEVTDSYVEVRAEKKEESRVKKKRMYREERSYRSYHRVIPLPVKVKAEKAKADFKKGVLEIKIPREKSEKKKVKRLKVK